VCAGIPESVYAYRTVHVCHYNIKQVRAHRNHAVEKARDLLAHGAVIPGGSFFYLLELRKRLQSRHTFINNHIKPDSLRITEPLDLVGSDSRILPRCRRDAGENDNPRRNQNSY
jgi:hypothetical protein